MQYAYCSEFFKSSLAFKVCLDTYSNGHESQDWIMMHHRGTGQFKQYNTFIQYSAITVLCDCANVMGSTRPHISHRYVIPWTSEFTFQSLKTYTSDQWSLTIQWLLIDHNSSVQFVQKPQLSYSQTTDHNQSVQRPHRCSHNWYYTHLVDQNDNT